jgi:uncharacterized membrane protein YphA (DoxX/SURF4 family)
MKSILSKDQRVALLLRIGLAAVFMYAAVSSLMHPDQWIGYLPPFLAKMQDAASLVKLFALAEIVLSLWLLSGKFTKYAGLLAAAMLAGVVVSQPSALIITFRDIGLVFMALALAATD